MGESEMEETQKEVEQELADLDGQAQTVRGETLMGEVKSQLEQTILALRDNSQHLPMKGLPAPRVRVQKAVNRAG